MYPNFQWDSAEEEGRYTYAPPATQIPFQIGQQAPPQETDFYHLGNLPPAPPEGFTYMRNPQTGEFVLVRNGEMPPWGAIANPPQDPTRPAGPIGVQGGTTTTGGGSTGGGGGGGGGWGYLTEPFTGRPPAWQAGASFAPPTFTPPPPFAYKDFEVPTTDSIYADPSYKFRFGEGQKAVEQSAAGRGVLRTGGTLKDIANYGQNAASQEYSNIFKRGVDVHNMGLQQALGTYGTNYGVSRDVFDRLYEGNKATFDAQQRENFEANRRNMDQFLAEYDIFERNRRRAGDYLFQGAGLGNG